MNYINNKNKIYKVVFSLIGFILMLSGVSYAYFVSKVNNNESTSTIAGEAANLELEFKEGSNQINGDDIFPGWSDTKTFTVKNKSSIDVYYNLYISDIKNELMSESISYKIESTDGGYNLEKVLLPSTDGIIKTGIYIKGNASHTYKITTYYNNLDIDQSSEKGKTFSFKINIKANINDKLIVDLNGGTSEQDFNILYKANEVIELKEPTRNGYTFAGWEVISGDGAILENLISNGSFEDGTNGWYNVADKPVIVSDKYKFGNFSIRNYQLTQWSRMEETIKIKKGHKYYTSTWQYNASENSSNYCYNELRYNYNGEKKMYGYNIGIENLNSWTKAGRYVDNILSDSDAKMSVCVNSGTDKSQDCYCDGVLLVDLTESFGSGNEPEKAWCAKNLDYFDEYALKIGSKATTVKAKWKKTITLTNLVENGSFEDGTNGWTIFDTAINNSNSYKKFGNTSIHNYNGGKWHTATSVLSGDSYYYGKPNHIYYASSWMYVKQKGAGVCYTAIRVHYNSSRPQAFLINDVMNTWQKKSGIINTKDEEYKLDYLVCGYNDTDKNIDCYCDGALLVDLTESFGAGNEPTQEWCDANLDWFDGSFSKEFIF